MLKQNYFLFFICLFLLITKIISIHITNFDLFGDEAQYWLWSRDFDFGYYSKPPLLSWTIGLVCWIFGNSIFVIKMISIFIYCLTSYVIFLVSSKLFNNKELALLTSITFFLMPAVSVSSFLVSTDILLIFFWSVALLQLLIIKERPDRINFILLGIFVGLAFLAKYAGIYFIICMAVLFFEKEMRKIFLQKKINFLYFIITMGIVTSPNIIWNINNNWATLFHTIDNAALQRINLNFIGFLEFFGSQIIMIGPLIFLFFIFIFVKKLKYDFNTKFLLIFSLPIFFIILAESMLVRANANWAAVSLISFIILFVHTIYKYSQRVIFINNIANFFIGMVVFLLIASNSSYELFNRINGITFFANSLVKNNSESIERLVVSDRMLFSNLGYIFRNDKITMYTPLVPDTGVKHHFQITNPLPEDVKKNFIFIGFKGELEYLKNKYTLNLVGIEKVKFKKESLNIYEVIF